MGDVFRLNDALSLLVRPSLHRVEVEGGFRFVKEEPLLLQLSIKIANTSAAGGGMGSSDVAKIPIGAAAHDLMQQIAEEVTENYWRTYTKHRVIGCKTLVERLASWCIAARLDDKELEHATMMLESYVRCIRGLLNPVRRWDIKGTCPKCHQRFVRATDVDGRTIRGNLLSVFWENGRPARMECAACGVVATGTDEVTHYARLLMEAEE